MLQVCLSGYCICFTLIKQAFYLVVAYVLQLFFQVFFACVSDTCFKCFICFQTYVANVVSGYFKSRSVVTSPSSLSATSPWCLLASTTYILLRGAGRPGANAPQEIKTHSDEASPGANAPENNKTHSDEAKEDRLICFNSILICINLEYETLWYPYLL
jgi:hypothetical protein